MSLTKPICYLIECLSFKVIVINLNSIVELLCPVDFFFFFFLGAAFKFGLEPVVLTCSSVRPLLFATGYCCVRSEQRGALYEITNLNPLSADYFYNKPWRPKGFFNLKTS